MPWLARLAEYLEYNAIHRWERGWALHSDEAICPCKLMKYETSTHLGRLLSL